MGLPYRFMRLLSGKPSLELDREGRMPKEQADYLMSNGMKGEYLGACLDSIRWGSRSTVLYELSVNELIEFINEWFNDNEDYESLFYKGDYYEGLRLPRINHKHCPRVESHKGKQLTLEGNIICGHTERIKFKPRFTELMPYFDDLSKQLIINYCPEEPIEPDVEEFKDYSEDGDVIHFDSKSYEESMKDYRKEKRLFNKDKTVMVRSACNAVINNEHSILSLEEVIKHYNLRRLNNTEFCADDECLSSHDSPCYGHETPNELVELPFDGWQLAYYVEQWSKQCSNPPLHDELHKNINEFIYNDNKRNKCIKKLLRNHLIK